MAASWISDWKPEDTKFWEAKGKIIARRNLIFSIVAEHLGFSVWLIWSIVATKLARPAFTSPPTSCFNSSRYRVCRRADAVPVHVRGDDVRRTQLDNRQRALLFIPTIALAYFVTRPDTPF